GDFVAAAGAKDAAARRSALDALAATARDKHRERADRVAAELVTAYDDDRLAVARRVVASEWSFGQPAPADADARSVDAPLRLALPGGRTLEVRGRVDRVDLAAGRADAAVGDYKTGSPKGRPSVLAEVGAGLHLQLPLYALAVEQLLAGRDGVPDELRTVVGRLHFVRASKEVPVPLEPGVAPVYVPDEAPDDDPVGLRDVILEHLAHSVRRLETGCLPLLPRRCPAEDGKGFCHVATVCNRRGDARDAFRDDDPQPLFTRPPRDTAKKTPALPPLAYAPAAPVAEPPTAAAGRAQHEAGLAKARDLGRDVILSAGAGSGKTRSLVTRHIAALEAGCDPEHILCITFTRKAAAEMRARIREALLDLDRTTHREEDLRRWIGALAAAPIHTIDAFASLIVRELGGEEVAVSEGVGDYAAEFVAERLAAAAAAPSRELAVLLKALPLATVKQVLHGLLGQERALAEVGKVTAAGIRAGWEAEAERLSPGFDAALGALAKKVKAAARRAVGDENAREMLTDIEAALAAVAAARAKHGLIAALWALRGQDTRRFKLTGEPDAVRTAFKAFRNGAARTWFEHVAKRLAGAESPGDVAAQLQKEAGIARAALAVAQGWLPDFVAGRAARGLQTFGDVLRRATELVETAAPADLAARFPFRHLLVDEFQDTDEGQMRLIGGVQARLRQASGRTGPGCRLFVVG
ncbi:MAG TPA: UvrD-helicase domain-containing protein, partial [Polyangia bacterium]